MGYIFQLTQYILHFTHCRGICTERRREEKSTDDKKGGGPETFDMLGFTHYWGYDSKGRLGSEA
jgi:hypothetical protein